MITHDQQPLTPEITLHCARWLPDEPKRAAVAIIHGHGDCIERYQSLAPLFTVRGIACTGVDLPGHGRSPGRRGAVPNLAMARDCVRTTITMARNLTPERPVGIFAHSMGGLLVLDTLAACPDLMPDFLWLSSPLLDPRHGQPRLLVAIIRWLARWGPNLGFDTGVRPQSCRRPNPEVDAGPISQFGHSRITPAWANELLGMADRLADSVRTLPPDLPLLYTQGSADPICPVALARSFFATLPCRRKQFAEFPDALHEPYDDTSRAELLETAARWLDEAVIGQR